LANLKQVDNPEEKPPAMSLSDDQNSGSSTKCNTTEN